MLTKFADWSSILGAVLGAAGLIYSILAFIAAKGAKQSAEEARRDVRSGWSGRQTLVATNPSAALLVHRKAVTR